MMDVIVNQGGQEIVCHRNGTDVACEMEIDVFHRNDLGVSASCRTTFHAENRSHGRFTQADNSLFANAVQCIAQSDGCRGFSFAGRGRVDGRYHNQFAIGFILQSIKKVQGNFGFVMAVGFLVFFLNVLASRNLTDAKHFRTLSNCNV